MLAKEFDAVKPLDEICDETCTAIRRQCASQPGAASFTDRTSNEYHTVAMLIENAINAIDSSADRRVRLAEIQRTGVSLELQFAVHAGKRGKKIGGWIERMNKRLHY